MVNRKIAFMKGAKREPRRKAKKAFCRSDDVRFYKGQIKRSNELLLFWA